jgi:hypothetical protein
MVAYLDPPTRRMLTKIEAANYCGFNSGEGFDAAVPVRPVKIGNKTLYDQKALDAWLDQLSNPLPKRKGFAERAGNEGSSDRHSAVS